MSAITIQETVVTATKSGQSVQLYISDAPRDSESAAIRLALTAPIRQMNQPLLAEVQRAALQAVRTVMSGLLQDLADEIKKAGREVHRDL
jgi:hypothetical protein